MSVIEIENELLQLDSTIIITASGWSKVSLVNTCLIPIYLLIEPPISVQKHDSIELPVFTKQLQDLEASTGILYALKDVYLVFYIENSRLYCLMLDFSILTKSLAQNDVFDKVLARRKQVSMHNQYIVPRKSLEAESRSLSSQILTSNEQITSAISKMVLSGLRIRGLSSHLSSSAPISSSRLAVREIYQMTIKSATFALRKFGYEFNQEENSRKQVRLDDIQEIVEKLLNVFIDTESI